MALDPATIKYLLAKMRSGGLPMETYARPPGSNEYPDVTGEGEYQPLKKMALGANYSGEPRPAGNPYAGEPKPQFAGELRDDRPTMQADATMDYEADPESDELPDEEPDLDTPSVPRPAAAMPAPVEADTKRKPIPVQAPPIPKVVPSYGMQPRVQGAPPDTTGLGEYEPLPPAVTPGSDTERMLRKRDYTGEGSNTPGGEEALAELRKRNRLGREASDRGTTIDGMLSNFLMDKFAGQQGIDEDFAEGAKASEASAPERIAAMPRAAASPSGVAANAAMGAKKAGPLPAAPRSVRNVTKQGISIGDRNMTLEGAPQPGIGLSMTGDRHASLRSDETVQEPQQPAAAPPPAPVQNPQAQAVAAAPGPQAPQDNSAYYAALRNVEDASWQGIGKQPDQRSVQDVMIGQEGQKQKDYRTEQARQQAALAASLKMKYETDREHERQAFKDKHEANLTQHWAEHQSETERHNRAMEARRGGAGAGRKGSGMTPNHIADMTAKANKELPRTSTTDAFNRLMTRINDPKPITGWDTAGAVEQVGYGVPIIGGMTHAASSAIRGMSGEAADIAQDAETVINGITNETSGLAFSDKEIQAIKTRLGSNQGEESFRRGVTIEMQAMQKKLQRWFDSQPPEVQERLMQGEILPTLVQPKTAVEQMRPHTGTLEKATGALDRAKNWAAERYNPKPQYADPKDAVAAARAQEDEEERKRLRAANGTSK